MNGGYRRRPKDSMDFYSESLVNMRHFSNEKERDVASKINDSEEGITARNELVCANLRFVVDIAKEYIGKGLSIQELVSAGNEGLVFAASRFDPSRGFKFIT